MAQDQDPSTWSDSRRKAEAEAHEVASALERQWGHPQTKWTALRDHIQDDHVQKFAAIETNWLDVIWTLDRYRVGQAPPIGMGKRENTPAKRLEGVYRGKGNWFADLLSLLLGNQTSETLAPRTKVQGFSQRHQIDIAWPAAMGLPSGVVLEDPRICVETKLTGAPSFGGTKARGAMNDWSNRRKELKFAATDLKLYRRDMQTSIDHWGTWRETAPPFTYFLWAARLSERDSVEKMAREAHALVDTYLEGAGIFAYRENDASNGYSPVEVPYRSRVTHLDDVLHRIASQIRGIVRSEGRRPTPQKPDVRAVQVELIDDQKSHND